MMDLPAVRATTGAAMLRRTIYIPPRSKCYAVKKAAAALC
jgi:hypothetical protein